MRGGDCHTERTSKQIESPEKKDDELIRGGENGRTFEEKVLCASVGPVDEKRKSSLTHRGLFVPL